MSYKTSIIWAKYLFMFSTQTRTRRCRWYAKKEEEDSLVVVEQPWSGHYFIYIISCRMCLPHRAHDSVAHLQRINNKINRFTTAGHCIVLHKRLPVPSHPKDSMDMDSMGGPVGSSICREKGVRRKGKG